MIMLFHLVSGRYVFSLFHRTYSLGLAFVNLLCFCCVSMILIFSNYVLNSCIKLLLLCIIAKLMDTQHFKNIVEIRDIRVR
jgi:hypothetical protein